MKTITESIDEQGIVKIILCANDGNEYPTFLPYRIESDNEVTVDLSKVKDIWEPGMKDDLVNRLDAFLGTKEYQLNIIGL